MSEPTAQRQTCEQRHISRLSIVQRRKCFRSGGRVSEIGLGNHDADSSGELLPAVKVDRDGTNDGGKSGNMDSR